MADLQQSRAEAPSSAKFLMLHGHGQSGHSFRCKTQFLQESVGQILLDTVSKDPTRGPLDGFEFHYPSGVLPADPDDLTENNDHMWAWGHGEPKSDRIRGLEITIEYLFRFMDAHGPFIGIIGFSTGATIATILASLLEKRKSVGSLEFNTSHPRLEFVVSICGLPLEHPCYKTLYNPKIETPTLHVLGTMDTTIEADQSLRLLESCTDWHLHQFLGTHHVPRSEDFLNVLVEFFEHALGNIDDEDEWEDLDD